MQNIYKKTPKKSITDFALVSALPTAEFDALKMSLIFLCTL